LSHVAKLQKSGVSNRLCFVVFVQLGPKDARDQNRGIRSL